MVKVLDGSHRFSNTDSFPNGKLPLGKDVIQHVMAEENWTTRQAADMVALSLIEHWIWCNVYPISHPSVTSKIQDLVKEFLREELRRVFKVVPSSSAAIHNSDLDSLSSESSLESHDETAGVGEQQESRTEQNRKSLPNLAQQCDSMAPKSHKSKFQSRKKEWQQLGQVYPYEEKKPQWTFLRGIGLSTIVGVVACFLYYGFLETRINTPLSVPKVVTQSGLEVPSRYWGTYRPGVYFGTSVRHPVSPVTGLMWFTNGHYHNNMLAFRHWCDQGDDLEQYGWVAHDGRNFGSQIIKDKKMNIQTYFVKRPGGKGGGDWSSRIRVYPRSLKSKSEVVTLFYYVALNPDDTESRLQLLQGTAQTFGSLEGQSEALGGFKLHVVEHKGQILHVSYLSTKHSGLNFLKETVLKGLRLFQEEGKQEKFIRLAGDIFSHDDQDRNPDFIVFQVTGIVPFEIDVVYESLSFINRPSMLAGDLLTLEIEKFSSEFDKDFELKFGLKAKGFKDEEIRFAKAALSNMVGGIGYFYGASEVQGENNKEPVPYWKAPLYTAVPSRSFFPRGFLWDEGFHNLLLSKWDKEISMDILGHWFDLMNWDGWIPREQILGVEARARVPDEFVVQHQTAANPPTLILTLHSMMSGFKESLSDQDYDYLNSLWPRLKAWYQWFNSTQLGGLPGTYRWRGRNPKAIKELNPKTLTSGLDDYPRASHPTDEERHLDLRCWMTLAAGLMADLARVIEKDPGKYEESYKHLSDNNLLDASHWSYSANGYMDFGLHTDDVVLRRLNPKADKVRVTNSDPKPKFVDSFGYVSFFPLFLQIIDPHSVKLRRVLEDVRRPELLWTPYGLRSLAKNSPIYNKWNTEHDPPYWRGSIWINMNFLAIRSLKYYSAIEGPNKDLARKIYEELRMNVISNVFKQYNQTGYLWEHYNDKTGKGEGCRPFTGWTALVVLIMGETY